MKKKSIFAALLAAALCLGLLAGCGGTPTGSNGDSGTSIPGSASTQPTPPVVTPSTNLKKPPQPDQILSDANQSKDIERPSGVSFTACEVIKRQSNAEDKEDIVYCTLTAENSFYRTQRQYRLLYNFYDEGGWILDEATPENEDEWTEAYLDAAGNDILDDIIWLDWINFALIERPENMTYICQADGVHYMCHQLTLLDTASLSVWDHNGGIVLSDLSNFSHVTIRDIFKTSDGALRFVISGKMKGQTEVNEFYWLLNAETMILSDFNGYSSMNQSSLLPEGDSKLLVMSMDKQTGKYLYGTVDENGAVVIPVKYESAKDIPGYTVVEGSTKENPAAATDGILEVYKQVFQEQEQMILSYGDVVSGTREPILPVEHDAAYIDFDMYLISVFSQCRNGDYTFRFYDVDGNCRSPEFTAFGQYNENKIILYQGRYGILPQIVTPEEQSYFWKMHTRGREVDRGNTT